MKCGKTTWKCPICEKIVTQNHYTWLFIDSLLFDLRVHYHCKHVHGKKYFSTKGISKRLLFLIPSVIANTLTLILWGLTYPIWLLHESLG